MTADWLSAVFQSRWVRQTLSQLGTKLFHWIMGGSGSDDDVEYVEEKQKKWETSLFNHKIRAWTRHTCSTRKLSCILWRLMRVHKRTFDLDYVFSRFLSFCLFMKSKPGSKQKRAKTVLRLINWDTAHFNNSVKQCLNRRHLSRLQPLLGHFRQHLSRCERLIVHLWEK